MQVLHLTKKIANFLFKLLPIVACISIMGWIYHEYTTEHDFNEDIIRTEYCRKQSILGNEDKIRENLQKIKRKDCIESALASLVVANYKKNKKLEIAKIENEFKSKANQSIIYSDLLKCRDGFSKTTFIADTNRLFFITDPSKKAFAHILIARKYKDVISEQERKQLILTGLKIFDKCSPVKADFDMLEAGSLLIELSEVDFFINLLKKINKSHNLNFLIIDGAKNEKIRKVYEQIRKEKEFRQHHKNLALVFDQTYYLQDNFAIYKKDFFISRFPYFGLLFDEYWGIDNYMTDYRYPAFAYIAKLYNNDVVYKYTAEKSSNKFTNACFKRRRIFYCEYAATAFARLGEYTEVKKIISPLSNKKQIKVLRKISTYVDTPLIEYLDELTKSKSEQK